MHGNIINVRTESIANLRAVSGSLRDLAEVLLFIADVVFGACNNASTLDALNSLCDLDAGQNRVRTECAS